jgi:hypothetical protein
MSVQEKGERSTVTLSRAELRSRSPADARKTRGTDRIIVTDDKSGAPRLIISRQRVALDP